MNAQVHPVQGNGKTLIQEKVARQAVIVSVITMTIPKQILETGMSLPQCTGSRIPCSLTEAMRVSLNGTAAVLPRSAYADLGDLSSLELKGEGHSIVLVLKGGDASESYMAKLMFDHGALIRRELFSSEDSAHPMEISRYFR